MAATNDGGVIFLTLTPVMKSASCHHDHCKEQLPRCQVIYLNPPSQKTCSSTEMCSLTTDETFMWKSFFDEGGICNKVDII